MSHARTLPSLLTRIEQTKSRPTSIDTRISGVRPHDVTSFTERYRGTEYESSPLQLQSMAPAPAMSPGRKFVIMSAAAVTTIASVILFAAGG